MKKYGGMFLSTKRVRAALPLFCFVNFSNQRIQNLPEAGGDVVDFGLERQPTFSTSVPSPSLHPSTPGIPWTTPMAATSSSSHPPALQVPHSHPLSSSSSRGRPPNLPPPAPPQGDGPPPFIPPPLASVPQQPRALTATDSYPAEQCQPGWTSAFWTGNRPCQMPLELQPTGR